MKRILYLLVITIGMSTGVIFAAGTLDRKTESKPEINIDKSGGVLVFARSGDSTGLDPARELDWESFHATHQIFDTLIEFKPGITAVIPALATGWEVSFDGLTYIFHLRKGVKFHDGTPFNADAVVFSFMRQMDENNEYYQYGPWQFWKSLHVSSIIDTITATDTYIVEFRLKNVSAPFLANLAMDFTAIVSPTAYKADPEGFSSNPVGTGPFKFVSWTRDSEIVLEKNPDYWQPVHLDGVILKVIPNATDRWLALQNNEVHIIELPAAEDIPEMEADPTIQLIRQAGLNVGFLALNTQKKPYDDKRVRQAMNYAIDRDRIIKEVYGHYGQTAKNPIPPTLWSYNDDIPPYPFDVERAKELLTEAGYPNGFKTEIWAMPISRPYIPDSHRIAEIMQEQLADVNIDVEIVSWEWDNYLHKTSLGEHHAAILGWTGDNGDPDNFLYVLLSMHTANVPATNIAFWKNKEFNDLVVEAKHTQKIEKRELLYRKAQEIFHEEAPWVTIAHSTITVPIKNNVKDFIIYPTGLRVFKHVWLEKKPSSETDS